MNNNQKGFTAVEGLLVLAVTALVFGVGWFIYQHQYIKPKTLDAVLSSLSKDAKSKYSNAEFQPKYDWGAEAEATVFNKVDGYDYSVSGVGKGLWLAYEYSDKSVTTKRLIFFKKIIPPAKSLDEVKGFVGSRLKKYGFTTTDNKIY